MGLIGISQRWSESCTVSILRGVIFMDHVVNTSVGKQRTAELSDLGSSRVQGGNEY
jgi:hypothetical protein